MKRFSARILAALPLLAAFPLGAQTCQTRDEVPLEVRTAIEASAQQVFNQAVHGDTEAMKAGAIASLQSNFNAVADAVNDRRQALENATGQVRATFLLDTGATPSPDGRYLCGAFSATGPTAGSAEFNIPNLPPGRYGIVIHDLNGTKGPYAMTTILQDSNGWKLAGFYVRPTTANGHDGIWHLQRAREFKAKNQVYNAWFYYLTAWDLLAPVSFIDTRLLSRISQESASIQPRDVPVGGTPVSFSVDGKSYSLTEMTVYSGGGDYDLSIRYSVSSAADISATQAEARALGAAYAARHPELKDGFRNLVLHAVDPAGADVVAVVNLKGSN